MSIGIFANQSLSACTAPLLDESKFRKSGGYQGGRYCGLGSFEFGATEQSCCFPCPMQDWVYPPDWRSHLRIPNNLSILSVTLCSFLLLSFIVLPPAQTHRHYLSIGLLIPVLLISLSFAIPVSTNPGFCYDAITPSDMHDSNSCAWTGSLVTLGGLGCVVWVFLRSLWLFLRIVYDVAPDRKFMLGSITVGTMLPIGFLVAVLTRTGFSYRMGSTCLPNHENAISTFWIWLVVFAILGFLLQAATTAYCFWIYARTLKRVRSTPGYGHNQGQESNVQTWSNIKKLFLLQWRNILVSVFVLVGSLVFFAVFWTQDTRLGKVFNDETNIKPVKTWILCQVLSKGDKKECRKYVKGFTVDESAVVTALVLASLVGIEIFILLFRPSMLPAWIDLFKRLSNRAGITRAPTPELTSLDNNPETYSLTSSSARKSGSKLVEDLEAPASSSASTTQNKPDGPGTVTSYADNDTILRSLPPPYPTPNLERRHVPLRPCQPLLPHASSQSSTPISPSLYPSSTVLPSPTRSPPPTIRISPPSDLQTSSLPYLRRTRTSSPYHPSRPVPVPPAHISSYASAPISPISVKSSWRERSWRDSTISALDKVVVCERKDEVGRIGERGKGKAMGTGVLRRGASGGLKISGPVEGSFRHVDGAFVNSRGKGRESPFVFGDSWDEDEGGGGERGSAIGVAS